MTAAKVLGPCVTGPGRVVLVVDPYDSAEVASRAGAACRAAGRFVVHASPSQGGVARLQAEVLMALGKHWNRASERGDATGAQLVSAWLRAEQARELTVLRAHQVHGAALRWLLGLAVTEGLLLRLVSPEPFAKLSCVRTLGWWSRCRPSLAARVADQGVELSTSALART